MRLRSYGPTLVEHNRRWEERLVAHLIARGSDPLTALCGKDAARRALRRIKRRAAKERAR
jgi:hypothetical protein